MPESYNVLENCAGSLDPIRKADHVLAFIGSAMYVIKTRSPGFEVVRNLPRKPDCVIGYYLLPDPHIAMIEMRK